MYKFFKGSAKVKISGKRTERFLNILAKNKILIWDVSKKSENELEFFVYKRNIPFLKKKAAETGANFEILREYGFFEETKRLKKRWVIAVFLPVFAFLLFLFSSVIWSVDIPKTDYIEKEKIESALKEVGIAKGKIKYNMNVRHASNYLLMKYEELIWANVEIFGTRVEVTLVPRDEKPKIVDKDTPCNIVAKKDGYIISVTAENGDKAVKTGDLVVKGQTLISGVVQSTAVGARYVHAQGKVVARAVTEKKKEQKLYKYTKNYTQKSKNIYEIAIGKIKIPIDFQKNIDFFNYDSIIKESDILFFKIKKETKNEYSLKKEKLSEKEAVKICSDRLFGEIEKTTENIKDKKVTYEKKDDETVLVRVSVISEEDIAAEVPLKTDVVKKDKETE